MFCSTAIVNVAAVMVSAELMPTKLDTFVTNTMLLPAMSQRPGSCTTVWSVS